MGKKWMLVDNLVYGGDKGKQMAIEGANVSIRKLLLLNDSCKIKVVSKPGSIVLFYKVD